MTTPADAGCYVEILGGPDFTSLAPIASTYPGNPSVFALHQGFFDGGVGLLPPNVADNGPAFFRAIVWKGTGGVNDWQTAALVNSSAPWQQATGANTPPNLPNPAVLNFPSSLGLYPLPEPSIIALGILGSAIWLICRRK